eukprot:Nk52_evm8s282 gene=Nk52_evmTU8s282
MGVKFVSIASLVVAALCCCLISVQALPPTLQHDVRNPPNTKYQQVIQNLTGYRSVNLKAVPDCKPSEHVVEDFDGNMKCENGPYIGGSEDGVQVLLDLSSKCIFKADVPRAVAQALYDYALVKYFNGQWHDITQRTGEWVHTDVRFKAAGPVSDMDDHHLKTGCNIKGHVVNGEWVFDNRYPSVTVHTHKHGPMKLNHKRVPVGTDICPVGKTCCIPKPMQQSNPARSWVSYAISLQRFCSPKIVHSSCEGMDNCDKYKYGTDVYKKTACNCIVDSKWTPSNIQEWGGSGVNCWDILPDGKYGKDPSYDMFKMLAYASQHHYLNTGEKHCDQPFDHWPGKHGEVKREVMTETCFQENENSCQIDWVGNLHPDWYHYDYLGHP